MASNDFLHSSMKRASKPVFFDRGKNSDQQALEKLFEKGDVKNVSDTYQEQLKELFTINHPSRALDGGLEKEFEEYLRSLTKDKPLSEQGKWVFFPWLYELIHILDDDDFQKVRTARNKNLITEEEQKKFYNTTVGIAGLSVGNSIALAIVLQGGARHIKLADHDALEISNLNRIRAGVDSLGIPKVEMTARQIYLLNPYTEVEIFPEGITTANLKSFVAGLDIIVDEVDSFDIKYQLRESARSAKIPVIMATDNGNGIVVDIERYDLEPHMDFFHGRFGHVEKGDLEKLKKKDTGFLIAWHVDMENISTRMWDSHKEIGTTLASWPQLGAAALLNGAAMAHAARLISSGEQINGRAIFSLDNFFPMKSTKIMEEMNGTIKESVPAKGRTDTLSRIIDAALLAPSGDNIQPWRVRRTKGGFICKLDATKDHSLYNTGNRASFVSLGAMVENAVIMAQSLNNSLECTEDFVEGIVTCTLHENAVKPESALLAQAIPNRVTNRNQFDKKLLSPEIKEFLAAQTSQNFSGTRLTFIDAPNHTLTQAVSMNEKLLFENETMHRDFFETLRWTREVWGLPIDTLALPLPGLLVFKLARDWQRFQRYNALLHFSSEIPKQTASLYDHAGAYAFIIGNKTDKESFYQAGRLLERFWLAATAKGLSVQPMTGIIFLHHALSIDRTLPLDETQREAVERAYEAIKRVAGVQDENVLFAVRLGFSTKPGIHSPRQTLEELSF